VRWFEDLLFDTNCSCLQLYRTVHKANHSVAHYSGYDTCQLPRQRALSMDAGCRLVTYQRALSMDADSSPARCLDSVHYPWTPVVQGFRADVVTLQSGRHLMAKHAAGCHPR